MGISFGHASIKAYKTRICNNIGVKNFADLKIAIVRDQLTQYGGAERALEAILDIFPQADIFAGIVKPINLPDRLLKQKITRGWAPSWLGFLMPFVYEGFDLREYDIIISEGTAWPKGVITNPQQLHISYIYTPPRFLYGYATEGRKRDVWYFKPFLKVIDHFLLMWDYSAAQKPDYILTISQEVAKRVKKFYGRESHVIYPPVDIPNGRLAGSSQGGPLPHQGKTPISQIPDKTPADSYYLCISRLAAYKNIDLLIEAFKLTNYKLKIAGTGKEEGRLRKLAQAKIETLAIPRIDAQPKATIVHDMGMTTQNVELLGFVTDEQKAKLLANCKGFIFPTDHEDFGIAPVEALAYGKPVLCHRSGGPLEIVEEGVTGMFFDQLNPQNLADKINEFDKNIEAGLYNPEKAIKSAQKFSAERFKREFKDFVAQKWEDLSRAGTS